MTVTPYAAPAGLLHQMSCIRCAGDPRSRPGWLPSRTLWVAEVGLADRRREWFVGVDHPRYDRTCLTEPGFLETWGRSR